MKPQDIITQLFGENVNLIDFDDEHAVCENVKHDNIMYAYACINYPDGTVEFYLDKSDVKSSKKMALKCELVEITE